MVALRPGRSLRGGAGPARPAMPRSPAFVRIRAQVLQVVAAIRPGRLCTFQSIGAHLDVAPRHVAYILSQLDPAAKLEYPWHRVVSADGSLGALKRAPDGRTQAELLADEGVAVQGNTVGRDLAGRFIPAGDLDHGLRPQQRPPTVTRTRR
jgi:methylated-DNA-protein-cysteine methyltransferase-like protein